MDIFLILVMIFGGMFLFINLTQVCEKQKPLKQNIGELLLYIIITTTAIVSLSLIYTSEWNPSISYQDKIRYENIESKTQDNIEHLKRRIHEDCHATTSYDLSLSVLYNKRDNTFIYYDTSCEKVKEKGK